MLVKPNDIKRIDFMSKPETYHIFEL